MIPAGVRSFSASIVSLPQWQQENAFILARDHSAFAENVRQRVQECQSCGYISSAMMSNCARILDNMESENLMINLVYLIRPEFSSKQLDENILLDQLKDRAGIFKACLDAG